MEFIRYIAIYARQSIDKKDSISTESQVEFCAFEAKGGDYRVFTDKGFSGKNTDRPAFQEMMAEIKAGRVSVVIVYKLDRISRSIVDFSNMMIEFKKYNVEFISSTEKFDTTTPMGRAMLNICIVFAQLERETTQQRILDAMYSRSLKGFRTGATPFGFHLVPFQINGINTKMLEADEENKAIILLMFQMYAEPQCSYSDIINYFEENNILMDGEHIKRSTIKRILKNPSYVAADQDIYDFFEGQGTEIVNDVSDFNGSVSCYLHKKQEAGQNDSSFNFFRLVLAPHQGIVPSALWLKCVKKILANRSYQAGRKVVRTWLAGKMRCGHCNRSFMVAKSPKGKLYFRCTLRNENKMCCEGPGVLRVPEFEDFIETAMKEKLKTFDGLRRRKQLNVVNPKMLELKGQLKAVEEEIEKLVNSLSQANDVLISYVNRKITDLDIRRKDLSNRIAELSLKETPPEQIEKLTEYLELWDKLTLQDKRQAVDIMIDVIHYTQEKVDIKWKI